MNASATDRTEPPARYEIRLQGRLDPRWSSWFEGMTVTAGPDGTTVLEGRVTDQAALHGLLGRLRDLGLPLLSVVGSPTGPTSHTHHRDTPHHHLGD